MKILNRSIMLIAVMLIALFAFLPINATAQLFPDAIITPDSIDFGDIRVGQTSDQQTFTVTKSASALPLYIFAVRLGDTTNYSIASDGCSGQTLGDGDSCEIVVTFTPSQAGYFETSMALINLGRSVINFAALEGRGVAPAVTLSTTAVDFGDQTVNVSSSPHEVLVINSGTASLNVSDVTVTGEFTQTDDCDTPVDPDDSCGIDITFTPTAVGATTGQVTITDDAADSPQTIALQGTGIAPGNPDVSLSTHVLDFGAMLVGAVSDPETVILSNVGTVALNITSIVASGDYAQTNDCGATVASGANCTISITFSPTESGALTGTITITDDATDSPQTITLNGRGVTTDAPVMQISATTLDFGEQDVATTSDPQTVTITNVGTADMEGDSTEITGDGDHSYSDVDNCSGVTVPVNGTCTIDVTFTPTTSGTLSATLTITNNASDSPQVITLNGTGAGSEGGGGCSLMRRR